MVSKPDTITELLNKVVVLDTRSSYIYFGTLVSADDCFFVLDDADVHDGSEGGSTKEIYSIEARKFGVKQNRRKVYVRASEVISLSLMDDIIEY